MLNPKLRMRPYRPGDEAAFTPREDFARERAAVDWNWALGAPGPTWTLVRWSGDVVGVGGAVRTEEPGVWQAWAQLAELPRRDWPQAIWLAERALDYLEKHHGAKRIEAMARMGKAAPVLCLSRLGFRQTASVPSAALEYARPTDRPSPTSPEAHQSYPPLYRHQLRPAHRRRPSSRIREFFASCDVCGLRTQAEGDFPWG